MPVSLSNEMRRGLGMTVAIWFPETTRPGDAKAMLDRTLDDAELFVAPEHLFLVIDGCRHALGPVSEAAERFRERAGGPPHVIVNDHNEGQGGAVACGIEHLLSQTEVRYVCTRDMDGDHDIYDTPQLYRRLVELERAENTDRVFIVGSRADLHRPMGFARGELEQVLNEVTVQALLAAGTAPQVRHCRVYGRDPDFQSGFKLYTRWSAGAAARSLREAHERTPEDLPLRWGVQFISTVELLLQGAVPACVARLTYDEQPLSTFEGYDDLPRAYGCQLAWLFRRLQLPPQTAWPMVDASLTQTLFATTPGGHETLLKLREYVARHAWQASPPPFVTRGSMF